MQSNERARELRRTTSRGERLLWAQLRNRTLDGYKFRRQHPIGPFIVDFVCIERRLVVEVDGEQHDFTVERDRVRDASLAARGYRVLRFRDEDVKKNLEGVVEAIRVALREL